MKLVVGIVLLSGFITCILANCRNGWVTFDEWCYLFSHNQLTWSEASETCHALHSHLATVLSAEEQNFLSTQLLELHKDDPKISSTLYWLDGSDLEVEHVWRWMTTGDVLTFTDWAPTEPNMAENEDCLILWGASKFQMGDNACSNKRNYICQQTVDTDYGNEIIG
ncbi:perlucin-like protein [Ylistrum balloti]|uniref:perlucin-like protein n=1 Tax=Ylistrum balloti TaxID=509963 RepID=UPI0029057E75|nr:perlucin-like protein [Ylistrum balloti]